MPVTLAKKSDISLSDKINAITDHRSDLERLQMNDVLYTDIQGVVGRKISDMFCGPIETMECVEATLIRIFAGYAVVDPDEFYMKFEKDCIHELHSLYLEQIRNQIDNPKVSDFIGGRE